MANNVRNKFIIIAVLLITVIIFYISLPILIPFIFGGSAAPFFVIHNHDTNSHEVTVEVFDQNNKSIINKTYILKSKSDVSLSRPLKVRLQGENREYAFKVTMDKQITNTTIVEIPDRKTSVDIRLYTESDEIINHKNDTHKTIPIIITTVKWM
ncbi:MULTISPECIES: hypothetical protein [unclassified Methanosarcina]|uniref:hypothetical protein n=1 Tax=unclassified Methanosarcina TaxID=2644672 RepID=UPI000615C970|nr:MULTISPECIES: hypothetical protein [unclassified Methanosarcina]AKB18525.1 hypothetical protein MSWHS_1662 [Methanosarcina sp. WWM596]AKB21909.1 hypothetical protein MSWH1_1638 [Methanosarcina sp. WH1]